MNENVSVSITVSVPWMPQIDNGDGTVSSFSFIMPVIGATVFDCVQGVN